MASGIWVWGSTGVRALCPPQWLQCHRAWLCFKWGMGQPIDRALHTLSIPLLPSWAQGGYFSNNGCGPVLGPPRFSSGTRSRSCLLRLKIYLVGGRWGLPIVLMASLGHIQVTFYGERWDWGMAQPSWNFWNQRKTICQKSKGGRSKGRRDKEQREPLCEFF